MEDAKRAYRQKMKVLHPDVGGNPEDMKKVKTAYEYLKENAQNLLNQQGLKVTHKSLFEIEEVY